MARMHVRPSAEKHAFWVPFITYETFCKNTRAWTAPHYTRRDTAHAALLKR